MSTATTTASRPARAPEKTYRLTFGGILKSEFLKFHTLASSWVLIGITVVLMVGLAALNAWGSATLLHDDKNNPPKAVAGNPEMKQAWIDQQVHSVKETVLGVPASGIALAILILVALAAVVGANEFGSKSIVSTLSAAPRRGSVFLAKTVVITVWSAVMGLVSGLLGWVVAQPLLAQEDLGYSLFQEKPLLNLLAIVVVFVLASWMGIGFGGLLRNNAAAIVVSIGLFFVLPILLLLFSTFWDWVNDAQSYVPWSLAQTATQTTDDPDVGRKEALGWFLLWCGVPLVAGFLSFVRRDPK